MHQPDQLPSHKVVGDMITGHFHEKLGYRCYRPNGTHDWLLIYTVTGSGLFRYRDQMLQTLPGDAILFTPQSHHEYQTAASPGRWNLLWAHFHPYPHWIDLLHWPLVWPGLMKISVEAALASGRFTGILQQMHTLAISARRRHEAFAMNKFEQALLEFDELNPATPGHLVDPRIKMAIDRLFAGLSKPISIADLGNAVGLSQSRFAHLFKSQIGVSPGEMIEQQRISRAKQLLSMTQHSIKQIAAAVGYSSQFYFSLRFKRSTGVSPSNFRDSYRMKPLKKSRKPNIIK